MMSSQLPRPPRPRLTDRPLPRRPLTPALGEWREGWRIYRCHLTERKPRAFNPTDSSQRFRPIHDARGRVVPTLYGADTLQGALAETILRDVPPDGDERHVLADRLTPYNYTTLHATRPLCLAILHDPEIKRLRVNPAELGGCPPADYPWTATWAQVIHDDAPDADGLIWVPRHHNTARALMFFGDRTSERDLTIDADPRPLATGIGRREVARLLELADIALIEG